MFKGTIQILQMAIIESALLSTLAVASTPDPMNVEWPRFDTAKISIVKIAFAPSTCQLEYIADELGFFREFGVKIDWQGEMATGTNSTMALAAGLYDLQSGGHADAVINARRAGAKVTVILGSADANKQYPHMEFYVKKDSPIHSAKDLFGKKIAGLTGRADKLTVSGCTGYATAEFLYYGGIDIWKANIEGVTIPAPQMTQALKQGLIDVGTYHPPLRGVIAKDSNYRLVYDDFVAISPTTGKGATRMVCASDKWIKRDPEGVRKFCAAMALAADWTREHEYQAKYVLAKVMKIKDDPKDLDIYRYKWEEGIEEREDVQVWIDVMKKYKYIKVEEPINPKDYYTNEYNLFYVYLKEKKNTRQNYIKLAADIVARNTPEYLKNIPPEPKPSEAAAKGATQKKKQ